MKNFSDRFSGQESLWVALPILIVLIILIAGLIFLPRAQTEIRSKASSPSPTVITPSVVRTPAPEIVCSALYEPVCGSDNHTYSNSCEANLAGVTRFIKGICVTSKKASPKPTVSLRYTLPSTN